jgi:hypothetical protein
MGKEIDRQVTYNKSKRKLKFFLFLLVTPSILMIGAFIILYYGNVLSLTDLGTVYIPLMIGYLVLIAYLSPKIRYNKMYNDYNRFLLNEPRFYKTRKQLLTTTWIEQLKKDGFKLAQEDMRHIILCKHYDKLPAIKKSDETLLILVIAKCNDFDFYSDEVDQGMEAFCLKHEAYQKVSKRITLQFKKYSAIDKEATEEVETAILYQVGNQTLVNLTFAYVESKNAMYGLNPDKWYPNRYAYFAFSEYKRICDIKE